jgi:protein phosphatase
VGLSSSELADLLLRTDFELQRSAREDGWNVNWEEHDRAVASSQALVREKRHSRAVREVSKAIQIVMSELPRRTS